MGVPFVGVALVGVPFPDPLGVPSAGLGEALVGVFGTVSLFLPPEDLWLLCDDLEVTEAWSAFFMGRSRCI